MEIDIELQNPYSRGALNTYTSEENNSRLKHEHHR